MSSKPTKRERERGKREREREMSSKSDERGEDNIDKTSSISSSSGKTSLDRSLDRLKVREDELCDSRRMLTEDDVAKFADVYRVLATNCENDMDTLRVVERMQMFLTRVEVQRTLTTPRKPLRPVKPTIVERFENGFHLRWCASKAEEDQERASYYHYEMQYGYRYTGGWKAVHVVGDTEYRLSNLKSGTSYMVRIRT